MRALSYVEEALMDAMERKNKTELIKEDKEKALIMVDVPGVEKENLKISVENNFLTITGKRSDSEKVYEFVYTLNHSVDLEKIMATLKNGVLRIEIGKKNNSKIIPIG